MKPRLWIALGVATIGVGVLAACGLPSPVCDTGSLVAPSLNAPADGAVVNTAAPSLQWSYPDDCHPEGYRIDLSVAADFSDTSLNGGTGSSATTWLPGVDLEDCTEYFWRVAGINGTTLGPFSAPRDFRVDLTGTCAAVESPAATASISGMVFHDQCAVPYASGSPLLPGCVAGPDGYPVANGVLDPGEPGLAGVEVELGAGACPSAGLATAIADASGNYAFTGLAAGTYCVSADALVEPNTSLLIPGDWTAPTSGGGTGVIRVPVTLAAGEAHTDLDLGWDFQFLPAPPTPSASATPALGSIGGIIWLDRCHFAGGVAGEPLVLGPDCVVWGDMDLGQWGANMVMDPGEEIIPGVTFRLGLGACPSDGYAMTDSNVAGYFMFDNLPAGTYCLSVNPLIDGNDVLLIPGGPSNPAHMLDGEAGGYITIPLLAGQDRLDILFGWEFQHLG